MASAPLSSLHSNPSSTQAGATPPSRTFLLRKSPQDQALTTIHAAGYPAEAPPIFSIQASTDTKPNILLFQGLPNPSATIGDATFHSFFSSTTDIRLRGQNFGLKKSDLTGDFSLTGQPFGKLKWKVKGLTGSSMTLCAGTGERLAEYKSTGTLGFGGEKTLEILVPCDDFFFSLVVLSAVTARSQGKAEDETVMEVVSAIVGA